MKITSFIFLFLLNVCVSFASEIDSLKKLYTHTEDITRKAEIAIDIVTKTLFGNPKEADVYLFNNIRYIDNINNVKIIGKTYNALGISYYLQSDLDSSLYYLDKAEATYIKLSNDEELMKVYKNKGLSLTGKGMYSEAIQVYLKSLDYQKKQNDTLLITGILNDIGNTYLYLKNTAIGLQFQNEALHYLKNFDAPITLANIYNSIGYIYDHEDRMDSAIYYYTKSLQLKKKYGSLRSQLGTKNNLCGCIDYKKESRKKIDCFNELVILQKKLNDNSGVVRSWINLSTIHRQLDKDKEAKLFMDSALLKAKEIGNSELITIIHKKQSDFFKNNEDYKDAYESLKNYIDLKDSTFYTERNKETVEMAAKYELEKKNKEIVETKNNLLQLQNEKLQSDIRLGKRNTLLFSLSILILGLIISSIFYIQKTKAKHLIEKNNAIIRERDKGLKAIINAQEDERTRIARELHDGIGNQLLALKMSIQKYIPINDSEQDKEVEQINTLLSEVIDEVRIVSHQMMSKVLQDFGCVAAIQDMLERTLEHTDIQYSFETHKVDKRYDSHLETALYRVCQELVNNVIKHSHAKNVSIQLIEADHTLVLFIEDDGRGIHTSERESDGIGIQNVKSRINAIQGEVNISSENNKGTLVTIRIPIA